MRSLPTRERGLKFIFCGRKLEIALVAPHAGAWIEIPSGCLASPFSTSLPTRERGLKCIKSQTIIESRTSLPTRERGLKYLYHCLTSGIKQSLPTRERGLKSQSASPTAPRAMSLPTRERGLKYDDMEIYCGGGIVAPHAGADKAQTMGASVSNGCALVLRGIVWSLRFGNRYVRRNGNIVHHFSQLFFLQAAIDAAAQQGIQHAA